MSSADDESAGGAPFKLKQSVVYLVATQIGATVVGAITGILVARLLGPGQRGALAAIFTWPTMLLTVFSMGIPQSPAFFIADRPNRGKEVYATFLLLVALQTMLLLAAGNVVIERVFTGSLAPAKALARLYLFAMPLASFGGVCAGILQGTMQIARLNLVRLIPAGVYLAGLVALHLLAIKTLNAVTMVLILQLAVGVALGHHLAVRRLTGSFRLDFALAKEIFAYSMKTQLSHAAQTTNLRLDQLAMSIFLAPSELGIYAVACAAPTLVTFGSTALATVVLPDVARRPTVVRGSTLIRYFRMNLLVLCGLAAAAVAVAPAIVPMLYGSDYRASVLPLQILCVAAVFQGTNDVLSGGLRGMNAPGLVAGSQGVSMAVTAVGLYLLLTKYGAVGAAITSLLAYGTASIFLAGALLKRIRAASSSLLPTLLDVRTLAGIFRRPRHCSPQGLSERR